MRIVDNSDWWTVSLLAILTTFVWLGVAHCGESPKTQQRAANEAVALPNLLDPEPCHAWVSDGAVEGESLDARIDRLETALRLAKAERVVNRRRK